MLVLSFKNGNDDPTRNSFDKYYMPLVEIKYFNAFYFNPFFDQPVESKQEACEKLIEMSRNDDYRTGNLLDYSYHTNIPQQVNFVGKVEEKRYFLSLKNSKKLF